MISLKVLITFVVILSMVIFVYFWGTDRQRKRNATRARKFLMKFYTTSHTPEDLVQLREIAWHYTNLIKDGRFDALEIVEGCLGVKAFLVKNFLTKAEYPSSTEVFDFTESMDLNNEWRFRLLNQPTISKSELAFSVAFRHYHTINQHTETLLKKWCEALDTLIDETVAKETGKVKTIQAWLDYFRMIMYCGDNLGVPYHTKQLILDSANKFNEFAGKETDLLPPNDLIEITKSLGGFIQLLHITEASFLTSEFQKILNFYNDEVVDRMRTPLAKA